jgi:hypothetical protein
MSAECDHDGDALLTVSQDVVATDRVDETLCDTLICCMGKEPQGCDSLRVSSCVPLW